MKVVKQVSRKTMLEAMKKEAAKKFSACNTDSCPRCRVSDG